MDISVRHLNRRMALQIPTEFPLGLVYVIGEVAIDSTAVNDDNWREFYLQEEDHQILCRISSRIAEEISIKTGDLVRAGGQIVFDPGQARYLLLSGDVELLSRDEPAGESLGEVMTVSQESSEPDGVLAPLPQWVKELAPPEVQEEWVSRRMTTPAITVAAAVEAATPADPEPAALAIESWQGFGDDDGSLAYTTEERALSEFSDELIAFLSEAIDSNEVIELTPAILADLSLDELPVTTLPPVEETVPVSLAPDPERAYAAQDASIEQFLSALEVAIATDVARAARQKLDLESRNGQAASAETAAPDLPVQDIPDPPVQDVPDLPAQATADSLPGAQLDVAQKEQTLSVVPVAEKHSPERPLEQPPGEPAKRSRPKRSVLSWFIILLIILAVVLLFAVVAVLVIDSGLIPSITF